MKKILFIAASDRYYTSSNHTYYDILLHFKNNSNNNTEIIWTNDYNKINKSYIDSIIPDLVVFFDVDTLRFADNFDYIFNSNIKIISCSLDLFYFNYCINCKYIQKCDGIFQFPESIKLLQSYKDYFPNKIIGSFKGRYINTLRYYNYNLAKEYDILIYGTRTFLNKIENHYVDQEYKIKWEKFYNSKIMNEHQFYPLRNKLETLLLKNKNKYRLCIIPQKGSLDKNSNITNENLSMLINKSHLTICTCSRSNLLMDKYMETAASYSAILGNIPSDYEELFKNNIVEVTEWMCDEEILSIIDKALEDKEKLWKMTQRLGDRVHSEYNLDVAVKNIDKVFDNILNIN